MLFLLKRGRGFVGRAQGSDRALGGNSKNQAGKFKLKDQECVLVIKLCAKMTRRDRVAFATDLHLTEDALRLSAFVRVLVCLQYKESLRVTATKVTVVCIQTLFCHNSTLSLTFSRLGSSSFQFFWLFEALSFLDASALLDLETDCFPLASPVEQKQSQQLSAMAFWRFGFGTQSSIDSLLANAPSSRSMLNLGGSGAHAGGPGGDAHDNNIAAAAPGAPGSSTVPVSLERLLDEDDLLQECKNGHPKLVSSL